MSLILMDTTGATFYTFPIQFDLHNIDDRDFSLRTKTADRFGGHGARQVGDLGAKPRVVKIMGAMHDLSGGDLLEGWLAPMTQALENNGEPYRFSWFTGVYINVDACQAFKTKRWGKGRAYSSIDIEIELLCSDPFWRTGSATVTASITTSPQDITLNVGSTNAAAPITIQADPTAAWGSFTIANTSDGGDQCTYADPGLVSGGQAIINAQEGTVERDGINTIRYFKGSFLRALPGSNTIRYTGPTGGSITLTAPQRWL